MENRQNTLDSIWQALQELPRMKLNQLFASLGLAKSMYAKLQDQEARKMFLGLATRLDDEALVEVDHLVRA
ncbi:hypothetical protein CIG75_15640 [Tumebacillus algifaecis]|uniref:Uncharacterized protein n=1 Tax=Tumebacillus algifaecis TaxID=1214604 RepID=A0A223D3S5_9BACL|nr:hypothetical protein [Tumebacillus algifaecis]ASS76231.1 hypothetical protein CIG75_15640 [Tumebacillus algifaecis]